MQKIPRRVGVVGIAAALVIAAGCGLSNRESSFEMPTSANAESLNLPSATDAGEKIGMATKSADLLAGKYGYRSVPVSRVSAG
ncbi:hypothetical protein AAHB37_09335 [Glutamicibacter halophytocola]|uniref:hypothetical protein n=1 Tax=Glutamicibacter halophytocola TaxID=1933880 RepID=UPI003219512C